MQAGRELDALVAEKVMGFPETAQMNGEWFMREPTLTWYEVPHYSTNIAAAWEVVGKLLATGRDTDLELELSLSAEYPNEATASIKWLDPDPAQGGHGPFYFTADAAPHAICLAALKAVGGSVD